MIKPHEILDFYNAIGTRPTVHFADADYAIPSLKYLTEDFPSWWKNKLLERGLGTWEPTWDCDDFAWTLFTDIRWAHYNTKQSNSEGIAVGVIYYMSGAREEDGSGGGHAINTAIVGTGSSRRIVFLEPQRAAQGLNPEITLTPYELESVWFLNY